MNMIIILVLGFAACSFFGLYCRQRADLLELREAIRSLCRRSVVPRRISFRTEEVERIWRATAMLEARNRSFESAKETYDETISLSARLAGASDEEPLAANALVEVLMKQASPEVIGVAVVLRDTNTGGLKIVCQAGLPRNRAETALLMCFDTVLDESRGQRKGGWGYHMPEDDSCFDFTAFGMGLCLMVPLGNSEEISGGIWLGIKEGVESLPTKRKEFIQAVAEHGAASFYAAKKARERTEKSDRERDFLLGMSHDLRAPGNRALYALRDLRSENSGTLSQEQSDYLEAIERAIEEQLQLLGDVLDYEKHQKGFLEVRQSQVVLAQALGETVAEYKMEATRRGLEFVDGQIPSVSVNVDPRHLKRMVANLLSNAVKYTREGKISLSVEENTEYVQIVVCDTGIGIEPEEAKELFKEFRTGRNCGWEQGVGLGLALTKVLAELNDGQVFYEPNPDGGSIFGIRLKCSEEGRYSVGVKAVRASSILVADDDPAVCRTIVRYLRDMADLVTPAGSLREAKELMRVIRPELVVSDLNLGDGDAFGLLRGVSKGVKAILITGDATAETESCEAEYSDVIILEKPVDRDTLRRAVGDLLSTESGISRAVGGA